MAAIELLCHWGGINTSLLSKQEIILLEAEFFICICEQLKEIFRSRHKNYFRLMKFSIEKENAMLDNMFVCLVIKDIVSTEEYDLKGIANYTETHEDVIQEVIDGRNTNPSANLLRRSINLYRSVRRELYREIIKKIIEKSIT